MQAKNNHLPQATCSDALVCLLWISSGMDLNHGTQSENKKDILHIWNFEEHLWSGEMQILI